MTTTKEQTGAPELLSPLQKLNAFGDRHAKVIILISSILVIVIVGLVAKILYDRTIAERAARDIAEAQTVESLVDLKAKYADSPIRAEIIYRLGNKYNEKGELKKALAEYEEFRADFPNHPLKSPFVDRAWSQVNTNLKFMGTERAALLNAPTLQTHPEEDVKKLPEIGEYIDRLVEEKVSPDLIPTLLVGPEKVENPLVRFNVKDKGGFVVELFEDDAPNATWHLVKQIEAAAFDGIKVERGGDTLTFGKPANFHLPMEKNDLAAEKFSVILRKAKDREDLSAGVFEILLRSFPKLEDAVVVGKVTSGDAIVGQLAAEDTLEKAIVERKRDTPYEPKTVPAEEKK